MDSGETKNTFRRFLVGVLWRDPSKSFFSPWNRFRLDRCRQLCSWERDRGCVQLDGQLPLPLGLGDCVAFLLRGVRFPWQNQGGCFLTVFLILATSNLLPSDPI
jgi:hypothetical protein